MTPEQMSHYTKIGLVADVRDKAAALRQAMIEMGNAIGDSSGFTLMRFQSIIDSLRHKLDEFETAIRDRDAYKEQGHEDHAVERYPQTEDPAGAIPPREQERGLHSVPVAGDDHGAS